MPLPVGSPPWITKSGTMRWKTVFLKKPALASETIDADAFGAVLRSSFTVKLPQLVWKVSVHFFEASRGALGFFAPPSGFGLGASTCLQPLDAAGVACVGVVVAAPPEGISAVLVPPLFEPHAPSAVAAATSRAARGARLSMRPIRLAIRVRHLRLTRRAHLPSPPELRAGDPRPRRLRMGRPGRAARGC